MQCTTTFWRSREVCIGVSELWHSPKPRCSHILWLVWQLELKRGLYVAPENSLTLQEIYPQRDTADAEIKVPSVDSAEPTNILPLKFGVGQNIAANASPICQEFLPCPNFYLPGPFTFICSKSSPYFAVYHAGPHNKIGQPAHRHEWFKQVPFVSTYII